MDTLHDMCPFNDAWNPPEWNTETISGGVQTFHPSPSTGSLKPALSLCHTPMDCMQGQACQHSYSCPDSKLQRTHSHISRQPTFDNHKKYLKWNSVRQIADTVKLNGMSVSGGSRSAWMVSNHSPAAVTLLCVQGEHTQQWHGHWGSCHSPAQPELEWEARKALKSSLYTRHTKLDTCIYKTLTLISYVMTQRITRLFISNTAVTGSATNSSRASPRTELQTSLQAEIQRKHLRVRWMSASVKTHTQTHTRARPGDASSTASHLPCWDYRLPPLLQRPV